MAMLAEPRRKQKVINLRAKNNAWSNDSTKFGQRMLEKMGWSSGKGLGANENGIVEHVVARYKNDDRGLGFEDKNDQWTKHEDDFNALLANLSNGSDKKEILHSGKSLEDKSKKSKARIHYHKFTRGKDMSQYSEKDLANIFGKKSFKEPVVTKEIQIEEVKKTQQVFTEKGSMADYFKNKLASLKSKNKLSVSNVHDNDEGDEEASYGFQGFSQDKDEVEESEVTHNGFGYTQNQIDNNDNSSINFVKPKKNKSNKMDSIEVTDNAIDDTSKCDFRDYEQNQENKHQKSKKKKKSKNIEENEGNCNIEEHNEFETEQQIFVKKNKKSKVKNSNIDLSENLNDEVHKDNLEESHIEATQENTKKNKKSKSTFYINYNKCQDEYITDIKKTKRKKDKNINKGDASEIGAEVQNDVPKKKRKK